MRSPRLFSSSTTFEVPSTAGPSSSEVINRAIDPLCEGCFATNCSTATTKAAIEVFMSAAPRPKSFPARSVGTKGSLAHFSSGPVGTTSVWPTKHSRGRASPRLAQRLVTSPRRTGSSANPTRARRAARNSWQPPSSGVTERRAISSRASWRVPAGSTGMVVFGGTRPAERNRVGPDDLHQCYARPVQRIQARRDGARIALMQVEQIVRRVRVGKPLVLGDETVPDHFEQRLLEGLRAGGQGLLHRVLHFADLAFFDQLGHVAAVQHDFDRRRT